MNFLTRSGVSSVVGSTGATGATGGVTGLQFTSSTAANFLVTNRYYSIVGPFNGVPSESTIQLPLPSGCSNVTTMTVALYNGLSGDPGINTGASVNTTKDLPYSALNIPPLDSRQTHKRTSQLNATNITCRGSI